MKTLGARRGALAMSLFVLLTIAGCGSVDVAGDLAAQLKYDGYISLSITLSPDQPSGDVVTVRARGNTGLSDEEAIASLQAAVWNSLPRRFDALDIRVGSAQRQASYQQLSQLLGPRNQTLDQRQIGKGTGTVVIVVVIATGLLVVFGALLAYALRRRRHWEEREQAERLALKPHP